MRTYAARAGEHIKTTLERMVRLANESGEEVIADFNGYPVSAKPGDDDFALFQQWTDARTAEFEAWKASPEGIAHRERREEALREPKGWRTEMRILLEDQAFEAELEQARARIAALEAENERLKRALRPFANYAGSIDTNPRERWDDGTPIRVVLHATRRTGPTLGDCRAAAKETG